MTKSNTVVVLSAILMLGCAASYLKNTTNVSGSTKDKVAPIKFEGQFVKDLALQGINSASSIHVVKSESLFKELTAVEIKNLKTQLVTDGYSGIIITHLIHSAEYTDVIPSGSSTTFYPVPYGRFGRYYGTYPMSSWELEHIEVGMEYTLESCLYDITVDQKDNLQWVGRFQVKNPTAIVKTIEQYSKELTSNLIKESLATA